MAKRPDVILRNKSIKQRKAVSFKLKGKKKSDAHRHNSSIGHRKENLSAETLEKMSKASIGRNKGEKHWNWKGGDVTKKKRKVFYELRRRARKIGNGGNHTLKELETLKAQYNWTCPCCKKQEPEIKLTEDHIIPLIKGGSDNIENIQPLCRSCNSKKATRIVTYRVKP